MVSRLRRTGSAKALMPGVVLLLASLPSPVHAGSQIFKWTDADGRVHYGDLPPDRARAETVKLRINTYEGPAVVWKYTPPDWARKKGKVTLYGTRWCGACKLAKAYLRERGVSYQDLDIENSKQAYTEYAELQGKGVPLILVGEQRMNGFSAEKMEAMLQGAGL